LISGGLTQTLQARLPQDYQAKFAAKDTLLSPIDLSVRVDSGLLRFDELELSTDTFHIAGSGSVGLDGAVQIRSVLRIEPELSSAIIRSVNELQALSNADGEMAIPLMIQGQASRLTLLPDLNYIASKVAVTKAIDLIGDLLRKKIAPEPENPAQ
jgi:hypothetical protein